MSTKIKSKPVFKQERLKNTATYVAGTGTGTVEQVIKYLSFPKDFDRASVEIDKIQFLSQTIGVDYDDYESEITFSYSYQETDIEFQEREVKFEKDLQAWIKIHGENGEKLAQTEFLKKEKKRRNEIQKLTQAAHNLINQEKVIAKQKEDLLLKRCSSCNYLWDLKD